MGELGFLSKNNKRTQTVECIEGGEVLTITYDKLLEIYFQNPEFGYYFLRLSSDRLMQNITRLEGVIEESNKAKLRENRGQTGRIDPGLSRLAANQAPRCKARELFGCPDA